MDPDSTLKRTTVKSERYMTEDQNANRRPLHPNPFRRGTKLCKFQIIAEDCNSHSSEASKFYDLSWCLRSHNAVVGLSE